MAERLSVSAVLDARFEEQLTCHVCLDFYKDPKTLPCLHSFCCSCLGKLPLVNGNIIVCPTCRTDATLPSPAGIDGFPTAFHLNNLKDMHSLRQKEVTDLDITEYQTIKAPPTLGQPENHQNVSSVIDHRKHDKNIKRKPYKEFKSFGKYNNYVMSRDLLQ